MRTLAIILGIGFAISTALLFKEIKHDRTDDLSAQLNLKTTTAAKREGELNQKIVELRQNITAGSNEMRKMETLAANYITNLQTRIAQLTPDANRGRQLPVDVTTRAAFLGTGNVYFIHNLSTDTFRVKVTCSSPAAGTERIFSPVLQPGGQLSAPYKIGVDQGWEGAAGDVVKVEAEGYDPFLKKF